MTPMFATLIRELVTKADLVDASPVMTTARQTKTPDEILCVEVASAIAEAALTAMKDALAPDITERELLAIYHERIASLGAPMPPSEDVCSVTPSSVTLAPGALYAGYEAGLARTRPADSESATRCASAMDALVAACRPGNTGADLYRAWEGTGNADPGLPLAHGLGLGAEPPLIGLGRGRDAAIAEGMVLSVQSWVAEPGIGGCLQRDTVLVESGGPRLLTRYGRL
jgi:Xaa-Pro aminopeptidase